MTQQEAATLVHTERALKHWQQAGLEAWEAKAIRLRAAGATDGFIGSTLSLNRRHVEAGLLSAAAKLRRWDMQNHRWSIPLSENKVVTDPLRGVVADPDHPGMDDPEHFLPITMSGGAIDDKIRLHPTLVDADALGRPLSRELASIGL